MSKITIISKVKPNVTPKLEYSSNNHNNDKISMVEETELGASLKQLNNDESNADNMSAIDMRSRLSSSDISASVILDMLVGLKFLPSQCINITKQKKRLSVSLNGQGRKEIVDVIRGERDKEARAGSSIMNMFKKKD